MNSSLSIDQDTVWSDQSPPGLLPNASVGVVQPLAWQQLEQRCIILEQLLTEQMKAPDATHRRLLDQIERLSSENQSYQDRIAQLETNIQDLLWISNGGDGASNDDAGGGRAASSSTGTRSASVSNDFVVESYAVSSLSFSDIVVAASSSPSPPPHAPTKENQPRGMFGETSIASTILPATSFESHTVPLGTSARANSGSMPTASHRTAGPSVSQKTGVTVGPETNHPNVSNFLYEDDSDSDLDTILAEAELQNGSKLSAGVIRAWKAIRVDSDDDDDNDHSSVQAVVEGEDLSETLQGVEFAGSNGPNDESVTFECGSPTSRESLMRYMIVTPIEE
jgi:hypothetical protein